MIQLYIPARTLNLLIDDNELAIRRASLSKPINQFKRGYAKLYVQHIEQAHLGADFDFLKGGSGSDVPRDSH